MAGSPVTPPLKGLQQKLLCPPLSVSLQCIWSISQTRDAGRRLPWCHSGKESACNAGVRGLILGLERSPGGGHGNPLQYSCLENHMDRGDCQATVHGVTKSRTQLKQLSMHAGDTGCNLLPRTLLETMGYVKQVPRPQSLPLRRPPN